mmetsp:Transcript_19401/g.58625  ORF Transcript_19401/g.58625 Transcript_19401/m.58625 type:complete len:909 (+) Transcript_19401:129-2855(+)
MRSSHDLLRRLSRVVGASLSQTAACPAMATTGVMNAQLTGASGFAQLPNPSAPGKNSDGSPPRRLSSHVRHALGSLASGKQSPPSPSTSLRAGAPEFVPSLSSRKLLSTTAAATADASASDTPSAGEPSPGALIAFQRDRDAQPSLGLVLESLGKSRKWRVLNIRGDKLALLPNEISLVLPGGPYEQPDLSLVATQAASEAADSSLIELAWEISDMDAAYTAPEMAELLFGSEPTAARCAAALMLLSTHSLYFKQSGRLPPKYQPRTAETVAAMRAQEERERQILQAQQAFRKWFTEQKLQHLNSPDAASSRAALEASEYAVKLEVLQKLALASPDGPVYMSDNREEALAIMSELQVPATADNAFNVLKSLGWWRKHDLLPLLRAGVDPAFPAHLNEAAEEVQAVPPPDLDAEGRMDLTSHYIVTIDDASTKEIDDGLSAEKLEDGRWRIWVHIADPTRWLQSPHSQLVREAERRNQSLYLPTGSVPMFPYSLAQGPFSLRTGAGPTPAMSVGVVLTAEGAVEDFTVTASLVEPRRRLTYLEADEVIAGGYATGDPELDGPFRAIHEAALLRSQWRELQGAVAIDTPEVEVAVNLNDDDTVKDVELVNRNRESLSQSLVAEMMILTGQVIGELGTQAGLPLPYRGQPAPVLPSDEYMESLPPGICRAVAVRNCMKRSVTTVEPGTPHAALGLPAYVQFTSPIRRYTDLLAHYQVKAHLRGEQPPFSAAQMLGMLEGSGPQARELMAASRAAESYWLAHYFAVQPRNMLYDGQLVAWRRQENGIAKVILDLGLEVTVTINRPAQIGDLVTVQVATCDPSVGQYTFQEVYVESSDREPSAPELEELESDSPAPEAPPADMPAHVAAAFAPNGLPFSMSLLHNAHPLRCTLPQHARFSTTGRRWLVHRRCV